MLNTFDTLAWAVAQLGTRMHYAVPRILQGAGLLDRCYTDLVAVKGWPNVARRLVPQAWKAGAIGRMLARVPAGVPPSKIKHWPLFALEYARRQRAATSITALSAAHLWAGEEFCNRIIRSGVGAAHAVYAMNSAALELLQYSRRRGAFCVLEQTIAPRRIADELLAVEHDAFPDWESPQCSDVHARDFAERELQEWQCADLIVCGSKFVRDGVAKCGGPVRRCTVVPYGVDVHSYTRSPRDRTQRLRVLTAGAVGLRKGAPYVYTAAHRTSAIAEFRWCGPITLLPLSAARLSASIDLRTAVPRPEMPDHYDWADVFLLPSICEGSATVCYEALAAGLPVITTPNAGSVVRDGIDGYIVATRDTGAIIERIERLAHDPDLVTWMSSNAVSRSREFTIAKYGQRLIGAFQTQICQAP